MAKGISMKLMVQAAAIAADAQALAGPIAAILAVAPKEALTEEQVKTNKDTANTLAATVKAYAAAAVEAGIPPARANEALRFALVEADRPEGTAKNYGRAAQGFMGMTEAERAEATMKDAQDAMRTPAQVQKDNAKKALDPYVKAANAAQLAELLEYAQTLNIKLPKKKGGAVTTTEGEGGTLDAAANG